MKIKQIVRNIKKMFLLIWKNSKQYLLFSMLQIISNSVAGFINIIAIMFLVDGITEGKSMKSLLAIVITMVVLELIFMNLKTLSNNFVKINAKKLMMPMSASFSSKAVEMDYQYTEDVQVLEQMNKGAYVLLNGDNLEEYLGAINNGIICLVQLIIAAVMLSMINPWITVLILVISSMGVWFNIRAQQKNYAVHSEMMPYERKYKYLLDVCQNIMYGKMIRLYDLESYLVKKEKDNRKEYLARFDKKSNNTRNSNVMNVILSEVQELCILVWVAWDVLKGKTTIGEFTLLLNTSKQFTASFASLSMQIVNLYKNDNFINDFFLFLDCESKLRTTEIEGTDINLDGNAVLELRNVSFKYPNSDQYTLKDISMTIHPHERISLVGENGAGKTTLVKLLMRLYDVEEGEILYNGRNIKDYNYDDYMKVFSTVFQDFKIFALSVYENITFQEETKERERINTILKEYGIWNVIEQLPDKGDTVMSREFNEDGVELSGGQQQRLALCRAVYKDAPVFILDEPTASLSPVAEHDLYAQFNKMIMDKAAIYISHRLSSSKFCDQICVLDKGQIVEYGTHDELIRKNGLYAKMYHLQSQYYV